MAHLPAGVDAAWPRRMKATSSPSFGTCTAHLMWLFLVSLDEAEDRLAIRTCVRLEPCFSVRHDLHTTRALQDRLEDFDRHL